MGENAFVFFQQEGKATDCAVPTVLPSKNSTCVWKTKASMIRNFLDCPKVLIGCWLVCRFRCAPRRFGRENPSSCCDAVCVCFPLVPRTGRRRAGAIR